MSRDPYDALGGELRRAVRARRSRRVPRGSTAAAVVLALGLGGGAVAAGATLLADGSGREARVTAALAESQRRADAEPVCRRLPRSDAPTLVAGRAPATLVARLGVLRRPQTQAERAVRRGLAIGERFVLAGTVRRARASDGSVFLLFLSRGGVAGFSPVEPVACAERRRDLAVAAADADVREAVLIEAEHEVVRASRAASRSTPSLSVMRMADRYGRPGAGGSGALPADGSVPKTGSIGPGRRGNRRFVSLTGLVPDGVVTVRVRDRDRGAGGRLTPPVRVAVRDNTYAVELPRTMGPRMVAEWLDRNGTVIDRTRPRY